MRLSVAAFAAFSFVATSGCVSQGKYDKLKADTDRTIAELRGKNLDLNQALQAEGKKLAELNAQLAQVRAQLKSTTDAKAKLENDLLAASSDRSNLEKTLAELNKRKAEVEARVAEFKALLDRFKSLIDAGKLKVKIAEGRMVVELASDILFASGSSQLSKEGKAAITEVTALLASIPDRKFQIEGHTDNVPFGGKLANWDLGSARANTVLKTMIGAGMPGDRVSAASFADSRPAQSNDTPEGKAANRRIEIVVVPDLSSLPGFEELNRVQAGS